MPCKGCNSGETIQEAMMDLGVPDARKQPFQWLWRPTPADDRIDAVLRSWKGTPYTFGGRIRGAGADCRGFVCGVLDELYRKPEPTPLPVIGPDAALHSDEVASEGARIMVRAYRAVDVKDEGVIEAGDVIAAQGDAGAPRASHALIATTRAAVLMHAPCPGRKVEPVSIYDIRVVRVYRPAEKHLWT